MINWDAVGASAEGIAAVVVIASVIYLSKQIQNNTEQASAESQRRVVENWIRVLNSITIDTRITNAVRKSFVSLDNLSGEEQTIAYLRFAAIVNHFEMVLSLEEQGLIPVERSETFGNVIRLLVGAPGWKQFWALDGGVAAPRVAQYLQDNPLSENEHGSVIDVFPFLAYSASESEASSRKPKQNDPQLEKLDHT